MAYFTYDNKTYFVCHGGIPYIPKEDGGLVSIAIEQLIKGVGTYNDNIDEVFAKNEKDSNVIQVHGHRNIFEIDDIDKKSYNLEGKIEFGGHLKVLQLCKGQEPQMIKIKNNVFAKPDLEEKEVVYVSIPEIPMLDQLRMNTRMIREQDLGDNISSFNFTRDTFYEKNWNAMTCKARGLFINTETKQIVARGYEKFFNINETRATELEHLLVKFKDKPITLYKKENGFLGIMSWVNDKLFMASKSTDKSEFAGYFRKIYEESDINKEAIEKYLQENNVSILFEVIDIENDPHIIKYDKSKIVMLDIVKNEWEFERLPYEELQKLASAFNCECKSVYEKFDNVRDFHRWYLDNTNEDDMSKFDIEGVVIECGDIMTKLKFPYYNFWKMMRGVKEQVRKQRNIKLASLYNATANYFYFWLKGLPEEELEKDIIYLREKYERENKYE